jgi:hypothetical protein
MRTIHTPPLYKDVRPWIAGAIAGEDEAFDKQLWSGERTREDDDSERRKRIKLLRKYHQSDPAAVMVANRLDACDSGSRGMSGACPECGHLLQRWFVRNSKRFISKCIDNSDNDLVALSIVPVNPTATLGHLVSVSIDNCHRRLKYALQAANIEVGLGGIDFSMNEDRKRKYKPFWGPHYYLITSTQNKSKLKRILRHFFRKKRKEIPRPIKVASFENKAFRRSYALKMIFFRRIGYDAVKISRSGKKRECRNTSRDKLRSKERFELFIYLNKIGLASRVIFVGATPISDASGVSVARRRSRNRNKQPRIAEQTWR